MDNAKFKSLNNETDIPNFENLEENGTLTISTSTNECSYNLKEKLVEKSIEAFISGIELYNKPTIKYRIEGFSFFVCNAWELMLKAELLNRSISIYYSDNPDRTISLGDAMKKIYSDTHTRIRLNLEKIIDLRNISTHYITQDYELKYAPLFQACVFNFINELLRFHNKDITEFIPQNFLALSAYYEPLSNEDIRLKYPPEIAEKFIQQANEIDVLTTEYNSDKFAISVKQKLYITKNKSEANFLVSVDNASSNKVSIVKELKDPANTHKYSYRNVAKAVDERLRKQNIKLGYKNGFTTFVLGKLICFYDVKNNPEFAYGHKLSTSSSLNYTYSEKLIDFIIKEIKKDPKNFVESLKNVKK